MVNMNILNCRYFIVTDDETCDLSIYSAPCTKGKCIIIIKGNDRVICPIPGHKSVGREIAMEKCVVAFCTIPRANINKITRRIRGLYKFTK